MITVTKRYGMPDELTVIPVGIAAVIATLLVATGAVGATGAVVATGADTTGAVGATGVVGATGAVVATGADTTGAVGASGVDDEPSFVVELAADGDATIVLTATHDLADDDERTAFRTIEDDQEAREAFAQRFADRLQLVADDAGELTDREMTVTDPDVTATTVGDGTLGVVRLSATWTNLAAVEGDALVVTEPFASGYTPDRPFSLVAPDDYELTALAPDPTDHDGDRATWADGESLDGFEATAEPTDGATAVSDDTAREDADPIPGPGPGLALVALTTAAILVGRRTRGPSGGAGSR